MMPCLFVLTEFTNVRHTHRQTHIQTPHDGIENKTTAVTMFSNI